jgi:hypothetical protein
LYELFQVYSEDPTMSDQLKEFARESLARILKKMSLEERLEGISAEDRLKGLTPEEFVKALSPETREALARQLKANGPAAKPQ